MCTTLPAWSPGSGWYHASCTRSYPIVLSDSPIPICCRPPISLLHVCWHLRNTVQYTMSYTHTQHTTTDNQTSHHNNKNKKPTILQLYHHKFVIHQIADTYTCKIPPSVCPYLYKLTTIPSPDCPIVKNSCSLEVAKHQHRIQIGNTTTCSLYYLDSLYGTIPIWFLPTVLTPCACR